MGGVKCDGMLLNKILSSVSGTKKVSSDRFNCVVRTEKYSFKQVAFYTFR